MDFEATQKRFADKLGKGDFILDFGCGSGKRHKIFLGTWVQG